MKQLPALMAFLSIMMYSPSLFSQEEFPKGWVMYLEGMQGASTSFHSSPDTYVGNLQLSPQFTVIPDHLRLAALTGLAYSHTSISATYGAGLNYKLSTIRVGPLGSVLNLQLQIQHLWGTRNQKLLGGGLKAELGKLIMAGITAHRNYQQNEWWLQAGIGFNLLRKKSRSQDPFENK